MLVTVINRPATYVLLSGGMCWLSYGFSYNPAGPYSRKPRGSPSVPDNSSMTEGALLGRAKANRTLIPHFWRVLPSSRTPP
jgi:hypothetical protein